MRAAVLRDVGSPMALEEVHLDAPGPEDVHLAVEATAICGSDLSFLDGHWATDLPTVLGHETVGRVLATGSAVDTVTTGDRAVVSLVRSCGACAACTAGHSVRCSGLAPRPSPLRTTGPGTPGCRTPGFGASGGRIGQGMGVAGFADEVLVHRSQVVAVPDDLPTDAAVLLGCGVVTGVGAVVNRARVEPGASVVVVGCGGVGIHSVQAARVRGAGVVVAVDPDPAKRSRALALGATAVVDPTVEDASAAVAAATDGRLADVVLVTVGSPAATEGAFGLLGPGGTIVLVGMLPDDARITVDATTLAAADQQVLGSKMGSTTLAVDIPRLVAMYRSGELVLDGLVTEHHPLERIDEAVGAARRSDTSRVVVTTGARP